MKNIYLLGLFLLTSASLFAQMNINGQTRYGNEWIRYGQPYFKIPVAQDGVYRLSYQALVTAGVPLNDLIANQLEVWHLGEPIPIYTSTAGRMAAGDFIEFYGEKNRGELDRFLYRNGEADMLNPDFSLFTDTAAYYLTYVAEGRAPRRYQATATELTNLPPREEWCWRDTLYLYHNRFKGANNSKIVLSSFNNGEGFASDDLTAKTPFRIAPTYPQQLPAAAPSRVQVRLNTATPDISHTVFFNIGNQIADKEVVPGFQLRVYNRELILQPTDTIRLVDTSGRMSIASVRITYPQSFHFNNKNRYFFTIDGNGLEKYLEIENFQHNNTVPILYDLTDSSRIVTQLADGKVKVKLPPFTGKHDFYLFNPATAVFSDPFITKVTMDPFATTARNATYVIITSRKLRQAGNAVQAYADYRASAVGGGHQVAVLNVEDLYEQFGYGVQRHSLAIRNFGHYIHRNWLNPKFVLILGKGRELQEIRNYNASIDATFFVPTFGTPGSDNLLLASNESNTPVLPIGRIAATKPADIELYLEKLKDYENPASVAAANRRWRKEVIHLGGGKNDSEQFSIESAMNRMQNILSRNAFGADVNTFYKKSTDEVQRIDSDNINKLLQQGVGMITFFGHGGTNVIDLNIGDPSTYTNYRQYPVMFALGCYSGNIHTNSISYSENFVFQRNKAGIAFAGTSYEGFISELGGFQSTLYETLGGSQYGNSLGEIIQQTIRLHDGGRLGLSPMLLQQYVLHGDPALKLNPYPAPDYVIDRTSVQFNPDRVSIREDSFALNFNILNIGKNISDSLVVKMTRVLPNNASQSQIIKIKAPAFRSPELTYRFPVRDSTTNTAGFNTFWIELDPANTIAEAPEPEAEQNNQLQEDNGTRGIRLFIFDKGVTPLEPLNYAIVNQAPLRLRASTANVFETEQRYRFAIDTSKYFNSPLTKETLLTSTGGVLEWMPPVALLDSTVYYWRVALDTLVEEDYNWTYHSFTYLKDRPLGWRQGHFQQLQENNLAGLNVPDSTRRLQFDSNASSVLLINFRGLPQGIHTTSINTISNIYLGGIDGGGVIVYVFDGASGDPWGNPTRRRFGSIIPESWAVGYSSFPFSTRTPEWRSRLIRLLQDSIPAGNYVLLHTVQHFDRDYLPRDWAKDSTVNLFDVLEREGATQIARLRDTTEQARPYMLFYRKGEGKPIQEILANAITDTISANFTIPGFKQQGTLQSRRIGPARRWARLQQRFATDESDQQTVQLYGIRADESRELLLENILATDTSLEWIDPQLYPYLELTLDVRDSIRRTPAQLQYWQVLYEGIPEAALNPSAFFAMPKDTVQEGEPLAVRIAVSNLSVYAMDSLLVHYTVTGEDNRVKLDSVRLKPLLQQDSLHFNLQLPTRGLRGKQELFIEINPDQDQPELYDFNNIGVLNFFVQGDRRNPLLDVTFDGIRIMNGDIVSAKPQIVISVRDENSFLPIADTSAFMVELSRIGGARKRIYFNELRFETGKPDGKGSKATIYYEPEFTEDDTYALLFNGTDASGNKAGDIDYKIEFQVFTKSSISNVFAYPSPFTTSTQFVYTLTGVEPPREYRIQIMTISGRVVRELTELDLGPLRIGTHRTELAWNGTDQYGDRLANGVYLYRMIVKDENGKDYEKFDNRTDRFFKNNIGKLVIVR